MKEIIQEKEKKVNTRNLLKGIVWSFKTQLKISKWLYVLYFVTRLFDYVYPVVVSYISAQIINLLINIENQDISDPLFLYLIVGGIFTFIRLTTEKFYSYAELRMNHRWHWFVGEMFLKKTSELDFQFIENSDFTITYYKVKDALGWSIMYLSFKIVDLAGVLISFLLMLSILLSIKVEFLILIAIPVLINYLINRRFGKSLYAFWDDKGEVKIHIWKAEDALANPDIIREAKIYKFTDYITKRFSLAHESFTNDQKKILNNKAKWNLLGDIAQGTITVLIQFWLINQVIIKIINVGNYTFYLSSIFNVQEMLFRIEYLFSVMRDHGRYAYDAYLFFNQKNVINEKDNSIILDERAPEIEFKNVSFKYPNVDKYILQNLSFKINSGEKIALVGQNGAGKTTLIKLLARFYDVTEGEILINGINIKDIELESYYKLWGCLFQSFAKLWFSPRENIGLGNIEDIENLKMIEEASIKAGSHDFIKKLKNGYENYLSTSFKDGVELSGGQWQKIGIARSIFANPKFIVLDEPTSALDALAEIEVFKQINSLSKESSVIIVSHRFATVRQANKILVLENGKILEQGSHEDLMKNKNTYYKMFTAQAKGYK